MADALDADNLSDDDIVGEKGEDVIQEYQGVPENDNNFDAPQEYVNDDQYQQDYQEENIIPLEQQPTTEFEVFPEGNAQDDYDASLDGYSGVFADHPENAEGTDVDKKTNDSDGNSDAREPKTHSTGTGSDSRSHGSSSESLQVFSDASVAPGKKRESKFKKAFDYDNDDADWDKISDEDEKPVSPTQHISRMTFKNAGEAIKIAYIIIELLEEDVATWLEYKGIVPNTEFYDQYGMRKEVRKKISGSSISIKSNISITEPGQPSTMRLFYEREENSLREKSIPNLPGKKAVDEIVEANLHRSRKLFGKGGPIKKVSVETQTRQMALVTNARAEVVFWSMYPQPDDWKPPKPPSRQASMQIAVDKAAETDKNADKPKIKPQIKTSIKKRILKPLPEDYYKDESFWTGSRFRGQYKNRQFHLGHFDFATGTTYESEFKNGHTHSRNHTGLLVYPRGDTYEGQWRKGRYQAGEIIFADGLKYEPKDWKYCIPPDRRFKSEKILGVHAAGNTIYNDRFPPSDIQKLPPGCYDVGEGIYDPKTSTVTGYDGAYLRDVTSYEHRWIVANCRKAKYPRETYIPKFSEERLPGSSCEKQPCNK